MTRVFGKRSYEKGVVIVRVEQKVLQELARTHARTRSHAKAYHNFHAHTCRMGASAAMVQITACTS